MGPADRRWAVLTALLAALVLAGMTPVELPTTEDPSDWEAALAMGGLVVGPVVGEAWVRLEPAAEGWLLRVQDRGGALHEVPIRPPASEQDREDIVWLAVSLLHPSGVDGPTPTPAPSVVAPVSVSPAREPPPHSVASLPAPAPAPDPAPDPDPAASSPDPAPDPAPVASSPAPAPVPDPVPPPPEPPAPEVTPPPAEPPDPEPEPDPDPDPEPEPPTFVPEPDPDPEPEPDPDPDPDPEPPTFVPEPDPEPEEETILVLDSASAKAPVSASANLSASEPWSAVRPRWFTTVGLGTDWVIGGSPAASLHLDLGFDVRGFFRLGVSGAVTSPSALIWPDGAAVMHGGDFFPVVAWLSPTPNKRRLWIGAGLGMRILQYAEPVGSSGSGTLADQIEDMVEEALFDAGLEDVDLSIDSSESPGRDVAFAVRLEIQGALRLSEWASIAPWFQLQLVALESHEPPFGRPDVLFPLTLRGGISFVMMRHVGRGLPEARRP